MKLWRQLVQFEHKLERKPLAKQIITCTLVFATSLIIGMSLGMIVDWYNAYTITIISEKITQAEEARMQERLERIENVKFYTAH